MEQEIAWYRFKWERGWKPSRLIARENSPAANEGASPVRAPTVYDDSIGTIWEFTGYLGGHYVFATIYPSTIRQSGTYDWTGEDRQDSSLSWGDSHPGGKTVNDTLFNIPADSMYWTWWPKNAPSTPNYCPKAWDPCDFYFFSNVYAWKARLTAYVQVVAPVTVNITSGPDSLPYQGAYTWTATASGGDTKDSSAFMYQWEYSEDNANWSFWGSNASVSHNFTNQSQPPFWLRVTAQRSGRTASATRHVKVASPLLGRLVVVIEGTDYIDQGGLYSWVAGHAGGTAPYTYQWWIEYDDNPGYVPLGTEQTQSLNVGETDGSFTLQVIVTSGDNQTQFAWMHVYNNIGCGQIIC